MHTLAERKRTEVFEACEKRKLRGEKITVDTVMNELSELGYMMGSRTTVGRYVNEWKLIQEDTYEAQGALPKRPDKLTSIIDEIRLEARREAQIELDKQKSEHDRTTQALEETLNFTTQELSELRKSHSALESNFSMQNQELKDLKIQYALLDTESKTKFSNYKADLEKLNALIAEKNQNLEKFEKQYQNLIALFQSTQANHQSELGKLTEYLEEQRHAHIVELDRLKTNIQKLEEALAISQEREQTANSQRTALELKCHAAELNYQSALASHQALTEKALSLSEALPKEISGFFARLQEEIVSIKKRLEAQSNTQEEKISKSRNIEDLHKMTLELLQRLTKINHKLGDL